MNNVEIIISRFNENLNWTTEMPFRLFKYTVYNKGNNENFNKTNVKKIINIENVGKNDHTYLFHIIENYNNLANITVFLPGSINLEYKKIKAKFLFNNIIRNKFSTAHFIGQYHENIKYTFNNFKLDNWETSDKTNFLLNRESVLQKSKIRPYGNWYSYFFGNTPAHWSTMCGIFSIDKRDILQHPVERYKRLLQTVNKHSNPEAGHYIERSWCAIFFPLKFTNKIQYNIKNGTKKMSLCF